MEALAPYWKAVMGFIAPAAAILISSVMEASDGGTVITAAEWITAGCTAIITSASVYTVRNSTPQRDGRHEAVGNG